MRRFARSSSRSRLRRLSLIEESRGRSKGLSGPVPPTRGFDFTVRESKTPAHARAESGIDGHSAGRRPLHAAITRHPAFGVCAVRAETNRPKRQVAKDPYNQRVWLGRTKQEERFWLALLSSLGQVSGVAVVSRPDTRATLTLTRTERLALVRTYRTLSIRGYTKKLRLRRRVASIDVTLALRGWDRPLRRLNVRVASMNRSRTRMSLQGLIERIEALLAGFEKTVPPASLRGDNAGNSGDATEDFRGTPGTQSLNLPDKLPAGQAKSIPSALIEKQKERREEH